MSLLKTLMSRFPTIQYLNISLIAGILFAYQFYFPISLSMLCFGICCFCFTSLKTTTNKIQFGALFSFLLGITTFQVHELSFTQTAQQLSGFQAKVCGTVQNIETIHNNKFTYKSTIQVYRNSKKTEYSIWVFTKNPPGFRVSDLIELEKIYFQSPLKKNIEQWMKKERIIGSAFVKNLTFTTLKQEKSSYLFSPITAYINRKRSQTFQNIYSKVPTHVGDLIGLIFFGYKQNIEPTKLMALRTLYLKWGLSHYLARSGLHIVILFGLLNFLLSFLYIPYRSKKILLLIFCLIYTVLSWTSISYLRALILIVLCIIAQLNKLQLSLLHLINLACFAILLWNPQQLFSLDFQLSFALTYILILMNLLVQIPQAPLPQSLQKLRPLSSSHT